MYIVSKEWRINYDVYVIERNFCCVAGIVEIDQRINSELNKYKHVPAITISFVCIFSCNSLLRTFII